MGTKFRLDLSTYESFWLFCTSLTNYHIKIHPLRNREHEQEEIEENEGQNESDDKFVTVTDTEENKNDEE